MKELVLESEAGFRALFEYATIAILVVGRDGTIDLINPSAERLFGYSNAELIGQKLEILIPESLRGKHVEHRENYFEKPKARPMGLGMDLFARRKGGQVFPVEISLGYYELAGEMLAVAFVTDNTERKIMEGKLRQANEELEKKVVERTFELTEALEREKDLNEMKSRFVSMASHEFRTPLSAILSSVSLINSYHSADQAEKRLKHIERIKSSVRNLTDILNNFLSLDKLEQGKIEVEKHSFDFNEFMADIAEEMRGMLEKRQQQLNYTHNGDDSHAEIRQDKKILRNIMLNLLSNAVKYSPEGNNIDVDALLKDHVITISIRDYGIGIPEDEQKNMFRNFYRAKNATNIQGTGLGLTIVKRYVELLGGTIRFESSAEKGTTFTIDLPANKKL